MNESIHFNRAVKVKYNVDVFIGGGGPAGIAAALAARACGASVYLAELQGCFGGSGTAGMVPAFMQFADGVNFLAGGVGKKVFDNLQKAGGIGPEGDVSGRDELVVCSRIEVLKRVYDSMLEDSGADFSFNTGIIAVEVANGHISSVICSAKSGLFAVKAKYFIDCTGDGDMAVMAGADFEKGDENGAMMAGTLCSLWAGIDWKKERAAGQKPHEVIKRAVDAGLFTQKDTSLPGISMNGETVGGGNIGHCFDLDGTDEKSITRAYIIGRKLLPEYELFYKSYLKGYEQMELAATASLLGVRESRRIKCDYTLNISDYQRRASFADEIGRYAYPVDIHPKSSGNTAEHEEFTREMSRLYTYKRGENYGIPYRCLIPCGLENLLVAGRCVGTDRKVQSSIRVMPGCFITGQAAGMAAAMSAMDGLGSTRQIDACKLREKLRDFGAFLP